MTNDLPTPQLYDNTEVQKSVDTSTPEKVAPDRAVIISGRLAQSLRMENPDLDYIVNFLLAIHCYNDDSITVDEFKEMFRPTDRLATIYKAWFQESWFFHHAQTMAAVELHDVSRDDLDY